MICLFLICLFSLNLHSRALRWAMLGAPKLVFDCSFSSEMTARENKETAKQLAHCFGLNRKHLQPFSLHYCGMDKQSLLWPLLQNTIPTLTKKPLPLQIYEEDACEVLPRDNLVILTPDSPNVLDKYNYDDHYVISGIVERGDKKPLTLAKAKRLNIRHARLPIDKYRRCRVHKALTLDQVLRVMLEVKQSKDWDAAFKHVPSRKFY